MEFKNKIAIVTGGSEGIGFGIAQKLISGGAKVYLVARTISKLEKAKDLLSKDKNSIEIRPADITDFDSIKNIIDEVYDSEERLDIFVNNAGAYQPITINSPLQNVDRILSLDFFAPFKITHYLLQKFSPINHELKILNILSQAAQVILENGIGYGTAKKAFAASLFELEHQLAVEKINNIKLYRLYPGTVATKAVIELVKLGKLQNPTSLESVIDAAIDLLMDRTKTRDIYVGFVPSEGIKRKYYSFDPDKFTLLPLLQEEVVDRTFNPNNYIEKY